MRKMLAVALFGVLAAVVWVRGQPAAQEAPDAVTADPDHYSVEFENDAVRLLRIRYGPGETSVMHRHPANCAIFLTDLATRMELPGGQTTDVEARAGEVVCGDAEVHRPSNTSDRPTELIVVELKERKTFDR